MPATEPRRLRLLILTEIAVGVLGLVFLSGCAPRRPPPQLGSCLYNAEIMAALVGPGKATYANTILIGGVSPDGEVNCFWTDRGSGVDPVRTSEAWQMCRIDDHSHCTLLVDHGEVVYHGSMAKVTPPYTLTGSFAAAFAEEYHHFERASPLRCSAAISREPGRPPVYVCR